MSWSTGGMIPTGDTKALAKEKNLSYCHWVHHEYFTKWSGIEPTLPWPEP